jgi:hypothetical protein
MDRRTYIATTGAVLGGSLAGCLGDGSDDTDESGDDTDESGDDTDESGDDAEADGDGGDAEAGNESETNESAA